MKPTFPPIDPARLPRDPVTLEAFSQGNNRDTTQDSVLFRRVLSGTMPHVRSSNNALTSHRHASFSQKQRGNSGRLSLHT